MLNHTYKQDARATERVVNLVEQMIKKRKGPFMKSRGTFVMDSVERVSDVFPFYDLVVLNVLFSCSSNN